jgi:hypothetical protein
LAFRLRAAHPGWMGETPHLRLGPRHYNLNQRAGPLELCPSGQYITLRLCDAPTRPRGFPPVRVAPASCRPARPAFQGASFAPRMECYGAGRSYFGVRPALNLSKGGSATAFSTLTGTPQLCLVPPPIFQRFVIPIFPNHNYNENNPRIPGGTRPHSWTKRNFSSFRSPV